MKTSKIISLAIILFICAAGWHIGGMLSPDAVGLALGVIFGMIAGVPAALIAMSASRVQPNVTNNYITLQEPAPVAKLPVRESDVILIPSNQKRIGVNHGNF